MDISPVSAMAPQASDTSAPTSNTSKGVDQDTFLKLLVAQLKNQDPLSPQDGTAFVAQLAQFSSLDQLISINKTLGQLIDNNNTTSGAK